MNEANPLGSQESISSCDELADFNEDETFIIQQDQDVSILNECELSFHYENFEGKAIKFGELIKMIKSRKLIMFKSTKFIQMIKSRKLIKMIKSRKWTRRLLRLFFS